MITTNTIQARAAIGATIAAICFAVAACGSEQGAVPTGTASTPSSTAPRTTWNAGSGNASPGSPRTWAAGHSTPPPTTWDAGSSNANRDTSHAESRTSV